MSILDPIFWLYVFAKNPPRTLGHFMERDKFFIYATTQEHAFKTYREAHGLNKDEDVRDRYIGRIRT